MKGGWVWTRLVTSQEQNWLRHNKDQQTSLQDEATEWANKNNTFEVSKHGHEVGEEEQNESWWNLKGAGRAVMGAESSYLTPSTL